MRTQFGYIIKNLREQHNLSQEELGNIVNVSDKTVSSWEINRTEPKMGIVQQLADYFNVTTDYLIKGNSNYNDYDNIYRIDKIKLPMLGTIACGEPIFADEDRESYIMVGTEIKADFCLKCQGDSMINARINDGDIVFIRKQDIVNNGEIAAVIIDDEATLKRFYYYKEQNMVILRPENSKYKDIILTGEELNKVKVLGKAVAFQSDVE
ncbi:LexA family transcriptional regulator [Thomasclavelia sp.]|uniref:LexA family protein n=1 Tax=Thomasclavelia sp. TaxID=3025757 RepID=UPI0025DE2DAA|nr:XRE family transcriptional regulator [Thomasclavelia sp.]